MHCLSVWETYAQKTKGVEVGKVQYTTHPIPGFMVQGFD